MEKNGRNTNHYQNGHIIDPLPGISHARGCACSHAKMVYVAIYFLAITSLCRVLHMLQLRNCCVVLKNITLLDPLEFRWEQMKFPLNLNSGWNGPQVSTLLDPLEFRWEQNEISIEFEFRGKYLQWNGPQVSSSLIPYLFTSLAIFLVHAQHTLNLFEHVVLGASGRRAYLSQ